MHTNPMQPEQSVAIRVTAVIGRYSSNCSCAARAMSRLAWLAAWFATAAAQYCACISPDLSAFQLSNGNLIANPSGSGGKSFTLPPTYGQSCATHDAGTEYANTLEPVC